jgi:ribosomal protein S18 acetylase RimI-like enzyme
MTAAATTRDRPLRAVLDERDSDAIERLLRNAGAFSEEEIAIGRELAEERLNRGPVCGYEFLLLDGPEGRLDGYCCFGPIPMTEASWDLYWIAVDPAARGRGIGNRLMAACEASVDAAGGRTIYIDTSGRAEYHPAHRLYESCGYRIAARFADFYAPGDDKLIMARSVPVTRIG